MSYNPNKQLDSNVCKGIEKLYAALRAKGITLKSIELNTPLNLEGKIVKDIPLTVGLGYNLKHIKVNVAKKTKS